MKLLSIADLSGCTRPLAGVLLCLGFAEVSAQDLEFVDSGQLLGNDKGADVALGDLDGDGDLDAFIANGAEAGLSPNRVYINRGGAQGGFPGQFRDSGQALGGTFSNSRSVALGDLDGDGDLDAFVANGVNFTVAANHIYWNDGSGTFELGTAFLGDQPSEDVALADIDGDGDLDAIVADATSLLPNPIWINQGGIQGGIQGTFVSEDSLGTSAATAIALGDLDGDGDIDAVLAGTLTGIEIWINQGGAQFGTLGEFVDQGFRLLLDEEITRSLVLADFNGDGDPDIYAANTGLNQRDVIWMNTRDANGDPGQFFAGWTGPRRLSSDAAVADFDGDGDLDVFVTHFASTGGRENAVWLNDGSGVLFDSGLALGDSVSMAVASGDLDQDGDFDVLVVNGGIQPESDRIWLAQPPGGGGPEPGVADLVMSAAPQGVQRTFIGPGLGAPIQTKLITGSVTNLGPDPATDLILRVFDGTANMGLPWTCSTFGSDRICQLSQLAVGETVQFVASSVLETQMNNGNVYRGGDGFSLSLRNNETDPTPDGRTAFLFLEFYACDDGCPVEAIYCDMRTFNRQRPDPDAPFANDYRFDAPRSAPGAFGGFQMDLPIYYLMRQSMNHGTDGQRLVQRYVAHQDEIRSLIEPDSSLFVDAVAVLAAWQPLLAALVVGDPGTEIVTQARVDLLDSFLTQLETLGSPALAQAIAEERQVIGPFIDIVGLTAEQAAARLIPSDVILEHGFERPETLTD